MRTATATTRWLPRWGGALLLLTTGCSHADSPLTKYGGTWMMKFGPRTFLVLTLTQSGGRIAGTLSRPEHFQTSNVGFRFTQISGAAVHEAIVSASEESGRLHFVTASSKDGKDRSAYDLTLTEKKDEAALKLADAPFDPWILTRVPRGATAAVSSDWEGLRSYSPEDGLLSSAEMTRLFEEDQKGRQDSFSLSVEQRAVLEAQDAARRNQTQKLLADGHLHTGEDFKRAAFIFQHGNTPDDYLVAHTLATVAVANGDADALWIAAATFDRYLQAIGKPQVYGTQFRTNADNTATQEPYNRALISDALRRQLGVPALASQLKQLKDFTEQSKTATKAK
jgi:hypothetical protein